MTGVAAAAVCALIPSDMLDRLILRSGLPAILAAAEPPLGLTARLVLILLGGGTIALLVWFTLFLIVGSRTIALGGDGVAEDGAEDGESVPVLRRADAHPDAPSRRPVFANRDLGTPFLEVRAPQVPEIEEIIEETIEDAEPVAQPLPIGLAPDAIPEDLDLPLSAFDPAAIRPAVMPEAEPQTEPAPAPSDEPEALPSRPQIFEPGERFETFALSPVAPVSETPPTAATPIRAPRDTQATINTLLERLERGVSDRAARPQTPRQSDPLPPEPTPASPPPPVQGLERTLDVLRQMATRG